MPKAPGLAGVCGTFPMRRTPLGNGSGVIAQSRRQHPFGQRPEDPGTRASRWDYDTGDVFLQRGWRMSAGGWLGSGRKPRRRYTRANAWVRAAATVPSWWRSA